MKSYIVFLLRIVINLLSTVDIFRRGAYLAGFPHEIEQVDGITPEELKAIRDEKDNKWSQPWQIYYVAIISSMAAVVQGMEYVLRSYNSSTFVDRFCFRVVNLSSTVLKCSTMHDLVLPMVRHIHP